MKRLVKKSSKKETYYTYDDENLGELKIKVIERFDENGKPIGIIETRAMRDDYFIPKIIEKVYKEHFEKDSLSKTKKKEVKNKWKKWNLNHLQR